MSLDGNPRRFRVWLALFVASLGPAGAETALERVIRMDGLAYMSDEDPKMAAAMRKARGSLNAFLAIAANPKPSMSGFAVKAPLPTAKGQEYVWLAPFKVKPDGTVIGRLANTPVDTDQYKAGETLAFPRSAVVDWTYTDDGRTHGNFTACVLLQRESLADAEAFKRSQGLVCDD